MRARWFSIAACCACAAALVVGRAFAQGAAHPAVTASVDACVPIDAAEFHRVLALELGQDVAYTPGALAGAPVTHVRIACVTDGLEMRLDDPVTRKSMLRVLTLESLPDRSRTRLLALAAAEFVVASWIELSLQPAPSVEPAAPAPSAGAREAVAAIVQERHPPPPAPQAPAPPPPPSAPAWGVSGAFLVQGWSSHDSVLIGAGLRVIHRFVFQLAWTAAVDMTIGGVDVDDGRVSLTHAGIGGALLLRGEWAPLRLYGGPGVRAGLVRVEGVSSSSGSTATGGAGLFAPMPGPIAYGRLELALSSRVSLALEAEGGIVTMPARALGVTGPVLDLDGGWLTGGLALGAAF